MTVVCKICGKPVTNLRRHIAKRCGIVADRKRFKRAVMRARKA